MLKVEKPCLERNRTWSELQIMVTDEIPVLVLRKCNEQTLSGEGGGAQRVAVSAGEVTFR